jgi:hypothetical protein
MALHTRPRSLIAERYRHASPVAFAELRPCLSLISIARESAHPTTGWCSTGSAVSKTEPPQRLHGEPEAGRPEQPHAVRDRGECPVRESAEGGQLPIPGGPVDDRESGSKLGHVLAQPPASHGSRPHPAVRDSARKRSTPGSVLAGQGLFTQMVAGVGFEPT